MLINVKQKKNKKQQKKIVFWPSLENLIASSKIQ